MGLHNKQTGKRKLIQASARSAEKLLPQKGNAQAHNNSRGIPFPIAVADKMELCEVGQTTDIDQPIYTRTDFVLHGCSIMILVSMGVVASSMLR